MLHCGSRRVKSVVARFGNHVLHAGSSQFFGGHILYMLVLIQSRPGAGQSNTAELSFADPFGMCHFYLDNHRVSTRR